MCLCHSVCVCACVCVRERERVREREGRGCLCVCVCVCVRERERERERQTDRQYETEWFTEKGHGPKSIVVTKEHCQTTLGHHKAPQVQHLSRQNSIAYIKSLLCVTL